MKPYRVKDFLPVLHLLTSKRVKNDVKCALLSCPELIDILSLTALNTLKGRVRITPQQKTRLRRYKREVKYLAKKNSSKSKKQKLIQKGGAPFLAALIGPAIAALSTLLFK